MNAGTLLLIEDDEVFASVIIRAFQRRDFCVQHAADFESARQLIQQTSFDYAVVDLNLAGHSSLELVPLLKTKCPDSPVLILTGYASIATAVEAIKLGADNYLSKPADANEIMAALHGPDDDEESHSAFQEPMSVRRLEWEHIQKVLLENQGNISETARQLKMHRRTLQRKLQKRPVSS
jgi:two-component system, response regulator RegA